MNLKCVFHFFYFFFSLIYPSLFSFKIFKPDKAFLFKIFVSLLYQWL